MTVDLEHFWPYEMIKAEMEKAGFSDVTVALQHRRFATDLRILLSEVGRRHTCSQLTAIADAAYETGLQRLSQELAGRDGPVSRENHVCLVTIRGDRPVRAS